MKHTNRILPVIAVALLLPSSTGWGSAERARPGGRPASALPMVMSPFAEESQATGCKRRSIPRWSRATRSPPEPAREPKCSLTIRTCCDWVRIPKFIWRIWKTAGIAFKSSAVVVTYSELRGGEADVDIENCTGRGPSRQERALSGRGSWRRRSLGDCPEGRSGNSLSGGGGGTQERQAHDCPRGPGKGRERVHYHQRHSS